MTIEVTITDGMSRTALRFDRELEDGEIFFTARGWGKLSPWARNLADVLAEKLTEIEALKVIEAEPIEKDDRGRAYTIPHGMPSMDWLNIKFRESAQACNLDLGPALEEPNEPQAVQP